MNHASWWNPRRAAAVLLFAVVYCLLGVLGHLGTWSASGQIAAWWAPSGLAVAALVRTPRRVWWAFLAAVFLSSTTVNAWQGASLASVLVRALADVVEPFTGAWLLRRTFGKGLPLRSVREVFGFAVCAGLVGPTVGALTYGVGTSLFTPTPPGGLISSVGVWWSSAVLGVMIFGPPVLTWRTRPQLPGGKRRVELLLLCGTLLLFTVGMFAFPVPSVMAVVIAFSTFPVLAWAAVRFGPQGASRSALALSLLSMWPYIGSGIERNPAQTVATQSIYALAAFTALTLSALTAETERLRKRAQAQALRAEESLALLETSLRPAPFGVAFLDRTRRIFRANDAFAALEGCLGDELVGKLLRDAVPAASPQLDPLVKEVLERGQPDVDRVLETGRPPRRWLCSVYPVRMRRGAPWGVGILMIDMTERIAADEENARLYREAQEAVQVREDFLSIASHELKTPLTPLAVRLHLMRRMAEAGKPIDVDRVDQALHSVRQLTDLINDLLDATRISHGRLELHPQALPFNDVVREVADGFRDAFDGHRLELDIPEGRLWVKGDPQRLKQVVMNLVDNAIKYSPSGGTVRLALRPGVNELELEVSDEGIGIPSEHRERLFERFHRAPNAAQSFGGLGLGLYISRDIVERHGGRIWAESEPGHGSTFHVVLPRIPAAELHAALH
ncbi:MAG: ATP-binding protein [Myxococcaceae bacterium]